MSAPLRVVAVDDERHALRRLEIVLGRLPDVELVGTAATGRAGLELIAAERPDVVLLDIAMPGLSGLEVAERLGGELRPAVIFVTAYDHHAVEAFERSAVDYLLKPVEVDRLARALDRARHRGTLAERDARIVELRDVIATLRDGRDEPAVAPRYETEFWAHRHNEFVRVPVETLVWVEAERDYVRLHQRDGSCLLYESISGMARRLDPAVFVQVHRSAIVRASAVVAVRRGVTGVMVAQLAGGVDVNVGRKYAKDFATFLAKLGRASPR
jgi:DNA-binding LytR/AlgR family response regulator